MAGTVMSFASGFTIDVTECVQVRCLINPWASMTPSAPLSKVQMMAPVLNYLMLLFSYGTALVSSAFVGHLGSEVLSSVVLATSLFNVTGKPSWLPALAHVWNYIRNEVLVYHIVRELAGFTFYVISCISCHVTTSYHESCRVTTSCHVTTSYHFHEIYTHLVSTPSYSLTLYHTEVEMMERDVIPNWQVKSGPH